METHFFPKIKTNVIFIHFACKLFRDCENIEYFYAISENKDIDCLLENFNYILNKWVCFFKEL